MSKHFFFTFIAWIFFAYSELDAQGCSDAGFCTIGGFKPQPGGPAGASQQLSLQLSAGSGDENVFVFTPALQYDWQKNRWMVQAKLTGNYASGNLAKLFAPGDLYLAGTYQLTDASPWKWQFTGGVKLPLSSPGRAEKGMPLPMQYQGSLGTVDIIAGLTATSRSWNFSLAVQQPLTGENKNGFLVQYWHGNPDAAAYPPSNRLQRKGDLLFRASRNFSAGSQWKFNLGVLNILHLGRDSYTDLQPVPVVRKLEGSNGLTINLTGSAWFQVNKKLRLGIVGGKPIKVRDIRPDGLTRSWIISPEISWQF